MYQHQLSLSLSLHDGTCLSLSLSFFPNGYRFEKPSTRVYHVSTEWSHEELTRISLFPTGLSHIREHARAENSGSKAGGGGGRGEVGRVLAREPPFRIWRYRIMKDNGVSETRDATWQTVNQ